MALIGFSIRFSVQKLMPLNVIKQLLKIVINMLICLKRKERMSLKEYELVMINLIRNKNDNKKITMTITLSVFRKVKNFNRAKK